MRDTVHPVSAGFWEKPNPGSDGTTIGLKFPHRVQRRVALCFEAQEKRRRQ